MNSIQALCSAGGTVRITVFRAFQKFDKVQILANVVVSCTAIDKAELIPINIFSVKGSLKYFNASGKYFLDFRNSKDPDYPNFWFGTGFGDYVSAYTIKKMVDLIPENSQDRESWKFVEFRVLEDSSIENVNVDSAYKQKRQMIAENLAKIADGKEYVEDVEGEQLDIDKIIGVSDKDSILV
jgi:hypothetical protein